MSKHTPGPWRLRGKYEPDTEVVGADGFVVADASGAHLHEGHDGDRGHWATTPGSHREMDSGEEEANARLIAAAPAYARAWIMVPEGIRERILASAEPWVADSIDAHAQAVR